MSDRRAHIPEPSRRPGDLWRHAGIEPSLDEALADPIVHQVMRRDGVTHEVLLRVIAEARAAMRRGLCRCAA